MGVAYSYSTDPDFVMSISLCHVMSSHVMPCILLIVQIHVTSLDFRLPTKRCFFFGLYLAKVFLPQVSSRSHVPGMEYSLTKAK